MKKKIYLLLSTICLLSITACGKNDKSTENSPSVDSKPQSQEQSPQEIEVSNSYIRYDVTDRNDYPLVGFGAQMDTDIYLPYNKMTKEDEALWEQRIKDMNLKYTRIKYFPEYFERENDNNDPDVFDYNAPGVAPDCAEMLALYKILDLAQKYDIKVDLSLSGCWNFFKSVDGKYNSSWLANSTEKVKQYWVTGPTDYYEYAESISAVLKYLIEVKHYTCIWGISNISESFFNDKGVKDWNEYVEATTIIHEKLIKDGIRDKVKFIGSSEVGYNTAYFREEFGTLKDVFDVCATGNYNWDYTCENESIQNYFEEQIATMKYYGKTDYAISEFCQGKHFLDAVNKTDIDDYSAGLYIARFCIEAAKAGVTAFDHYILGDCWFTNSYVHTMGLWMYRDSNVTNPEYISWAAHPEYYFYGLVCKYTDTGAYAYKLQQTLKTEYDDPDRAIAIVAFELPDGSWTYMIANTAKEAKKVAIVNQKDGHPGTMQCYKVTESGIPEDRACVLPESYKEVDASSGVCYLTVPANGFLVVSDKKC